MSWHPKTGGAKDLVKTGHCADFKPPLPDVRSLATFPGLKKFWDALNPMKKTEVETMTPTPETTPAAAPESAGPEMPVETHTATPEELAELRERAARADENWDRLLRQTADFENFKKRTARERQEAVKFANEALLQKLLPVLDNFEMALAAAATAPAEGVKSLQDGVTMILQQLRQTLIEAGLEEIDALGKPFDPNFHEAVSQQESADVPEGQVIQQLRRGYRLRERLLRPASVIVAKSPAA
jgi:molecular chaperone GrpE